MKKFLLAILVLMAFVGTLLAAGEGQGAVVRSPASAGVSATGVYVNITFTAGAQAWSAGKLYMSLPSGTGWSTMSFTDSAAGQITVTAINASGVTYATDGKTLTITVSSMPGLTGKLGIFYMNATMANAAGNKTFPFKTAPTGGAGLSISSPPYINLITGTETPTFTVTLTVTQTSTKTVTQTVTKTVTKTVTGTVTKTVTKTITPTVTKTITETLVATLTVTPTITQTITQTVTPSVTPTITETIVATVTSTYTVTPQQTAVPASLGAVVKSKFMEAQEKGLLYNWMNEIATGALDTTKQYEMIMSTMDSYSFKFNAMYTGQVTVRIYRIAAADSAGGTTITARNSNDDSKYMALTANSKIYEDGGYNTSNATLIYAMMIGGGNTKEIYCPKFFGSGLHYIISIETKEVDNEGSLFWEFYGN